MEISKEQFVQAASKLGLSEQQKKGLWDALEAQGNTKESSFSTLLYYFGAVIVILALTWLINIGWQVFGGGGILAISLVYAILFFLVGAKLWNKEGLRIPAGLLITLAVCMTPLIIFGIQSLFGFEPQNYTENYLSFFATLKSSWIWMEIGTIIVGLVALRFYPFPFLTAPIFFSAWLLSMDIIPFVVRREGAFDEKAWVSLIFGVVILLIAYFIDQKKPQYGFWAYLFGTITFWGSVTALCSDKGELVLFIYLLINLVMMFASILLQRKVLLIFGALGAFVYFSHLAYDLFEDSFLFPFVLTILGLVVIYLGILYQRNSAWIEERVRNLLTRRV